MSIDHFNYKCKAFVFLFSYACVWVNVWRASYVFCCACGYVCVRTWLVYVRTCTRCTYECLRSYFIHSYIVACVCKFWIFEFTMNSFICACVCAFIMVHLFTRLGSYMAVRRAHGTSARSQPISVQSEICHGCAAVTNLVCLDTLCRHSNLTSLLMELYWQGCFVFLFIIYSFLINIGFALFRVLYFYNLVCICEIIVKPM